MNEIQNNTEQRRRFLIGLAYGIALIALAALGCKYALSTLLPFFIAWVVAAILRPLLRLFRNKKHLPYRTMCVAITLLFYLLIAFMGVILFSRLLEVAVSFLSSIPEFWSNTLMPMLQTFGERIAEVFAQFNVNLSLPVSEMVSSLGKTITSYSAQLLGKIGNMAISLPGMLVDTIICIVSTIYLLLDWDAIKNFIYRQLPQKATEILSKASGQLGKTLWQYIRSYGLIMLITFAELSIGFMLIGIRTPFLLGALIAIFDILPIVGSGTILLPWMIISFAMGNIHNGIGLLLLYIVVTVIRNIIEPKLVGKQVGLHPLVTLLSMVIGSSVFGGIGVLGLPVAVAVAKQLNDDGVLNILK